MKSICKIEEIKEINGIKRKTIYREYGGKFCWVCGNYCNVTKHHLIPKSLNPINQILIPLCDNCHKKLHGIIKFTQEDENEVKE